MGFRGITICWRFLTTINEADIPAEFMAFYTAIRDGAAATNQLCQMNGQPPEEDSVRNKMIEVMGRCLQKKSPILPSIGYALMINDETWQVLLRPSAIPHFEVVVIENEPKLESDIAGRFEIVRWLMEHRVAGFGRRNNNGLQGKTWELYLFCKIRLLKNLRKSFQRLPFQRRTVLVPPDRVFPELQADSLNTSTVGNRREDIERFLDDCDEVLLKKVGPTAISEYLRPSSITLKEFMRAQRPTLFGIRF